MQFNSAAVLLAAGLSIAAVDAAAAQTPSPPPSRDFVSAAVESDTYEMLSSRTALTESRDPRVRSFAQMMIADHAQTSATLRQAAARAGVEAPPPSLSSDQSKLLNTLHGLEGPQFDRAYAHQQFLAHHQALTVQSLYADGGSNPDLRRAAQSAVPLIQHHLQMAQQLPGASGE